MRNDVGNYQLRSEKSAAGDIIDFGNDRGMIGSQETGLVEGDT